MDKQHPIDRLTEILENIEHVERAFLEADKLKEYILDYYKDDEHKYACAVGCLSVVVGELFWQIKKLKNDSL